MKKITLVVAVLLLVALSSTVAFAGEMKFARFTACKTIESNDFRTPPTDVDASEKKALADAERWMDANRSKVRVLSHSLTGNYSGPGTSVGRRVVWGFSTVTILYEEK